MSSTEEKIDVLLKEVKNLTVGQLKLTETVESINKRSSTTDKVARDLGEEIRNLTSRLEALSSTSSKVPPHEEEGRASGHRIETPLQGADDGIHLPHPILGKGENQSPKHSFTNFDRNESGGRRSEFGLNPREPKLPEIDFPKFSGDNPRVSREKCEKYFSM
ncbi:unnamed protein product [Urochloa humidicola]